MFETFDAFLELKYGKLAFLDLHGLTKEEARAALVLKLNRIDIDTKGIVVVHGYHQGIVLKNFVRNEFEHKNIKQKVNIDASRTLLLVNLEK